jgi:hypothetical protein
MNAEFLAQSELLQLEKIRIKIRLIKYRMQALSVLMHDHKTMKPEHREEFLYLNDDLLDAKVTEANITYMRNLL